MGKMYIGTKNGKKEVVMGGSGINATSGEKIFTSSGTFTVPAGVHHIDVFLVGGGAGSGGFSYSTSVRVCNGGNGLTRTITHLPVIPGTSHSIVIGDGGTTNGNLNESTATGSSSSIQFYGGDGGDTRFDGYICKGGSHLYIGSNSSEIVCDRTSISIPKVESLYYSSGVYYKQENPIVAICSRLQEDRTYAFGIRTETEYCISGRPGCGGLIQQIDLGSQWIVHLQKGQPGICIIRW